MNRTLRGFIKKELTQSVRDPQMKFFLFVAPLIQMTLFGVAASNEVKNIRLAAVFDSKDYVMRDIYERALTGDNFIAANVRGEQDPYQMVKSGRADAVLVPPPGGLTKAIGRETAPLQLLTDATNVIQAQSVENYIRTIALQTIRDDLKLSPPESPIQLDVRVLYNPSLDTAIFMVPGVMCTLLVLTTVILSMSAIVKERERGTLEMLISAPISPSEVIFGKTIPYVILGFTNFPLILGVAVFVFGVPVRGSLLVLVIAALAFICTCVALGTLLSTFCRNQQQAIMASFLVIFPAIMFSGLLFPIENMPDIFQWIAYLDPLSHYLGLLRNILLKGGGTAYTVTHISALVGLAFVFIVISFRRFHTTLQ